MDDFEWTPPGLSEPEAATFLATREGIPEYARPEIIRWLLRDKYDNDFVNFGDFLKFQTALRRPLNLGSTKKVRVITMRKWLTQLDEDTLTSFVDFRLSTMSPRPSFDSQPRNDVLAIKNILQVAGSSWTVGDRNDRWGLVEALPGAVISAAQAVVSQPNKASQLLNAAWADAFGTDKRPSHAYSNAVKAVEIFSCPLISPHDKKATLGKDINVLANKPENWEFVLSGDQSIEELINTLRLLWHSQRDRHGQEDYKGVDEGEAQGAVLLATTIVGWLSQGLLKRIDR